MAYDYINQLLANVNGDDYGIKLRKKTPEEMQQKEPLQLDEGVDLLGQPPARNIASASYDRPIMDVDQAIEDEINDISGDETDSEIQRDVIASPALPAYPKVELKSTGAKQYQDVVQKQQDYLSGERQKAENEYERLLGKRADIKKPSTTEADKIMGALVPLAVAAFGGEAGALSQPAAFKSYQGYLDAEEKKQAAQYKEDLKNNELKLTAAQRKSDALQNRQNNLTTDSAWKTAQMEQAEAKDDKDFEQQIALAKMQASLRPKGSAMGTFEKSALANLGKKVSNMKSSVANFGQLQKIFDNPNMKDNVKVQAFNDMLKAYNSPENPDAAGKEEVNRLSTFLQVMPNPLSPKGMKVGYDIPNFKLQLQNTIDRMNGQIQADLLTAQQISEGGGAALQKPAPKQPGQNSPPAESQKPKAQVLEKKNPDGSKTRYILQPNGKYKAE